MAGNVASNALKTGSNPRNLFVRCANDLRARVLHLDKQFIVVNKPNNILSQPDATGDESLDESAARFLKEHYDKPGNAYVGVVHRLDRPASGLTVLATTSKAASRLAEQIRERRFKKDYLAVVPQKNLGDKEEGEIGSDDDALFWKKVYMARNNMYAVLHVRIFSGKKHQIRRQLASKNIGPIIGDLRFGSTFQYPHDFTPRQGIMLHASKISFTHPTRPEEKIDIECPPPWPEDFWPGFFHRRAKRSSD